MNATTPTLDARLAALDKDLRYLDTLDPLYLGALEVLVKFGIDERTKAEQDRIHEAATGRRHRGRLRVVTQKGGTS